MAVSVTERGGRVVPGVTFIEDLRAPRDLREHPVLNQFRDLFALAVKRTPPDQGKPPRGAVRVTRFGEISLLVGIRMAWDNDGLSRSVIGLAGRPAEKFTPVEIAVIGVTPDRMFHEIMIRGNIPQLTSQRLEDVMAASISRVALLREEDLRPRIAVEAPKA